MANVLIRIDNSTELCLTDNNYFLCKIKKKEGFKNIYNSF